MSYCLFIETLGRFGNISILIDSQQPECKELIIDEIGVALLGDEVLVKEGLDGGHHATGRPQLVFLDECSSCDVLGLTFSCDGRENEALAL